MKTDITFNRLPAEALERWTVTRAVISGDQAVKKAKLLPYLNPLDVSSENKRRNESYVERAVFYNATGRTLDGLIGIAFKKDPSANLPAYLDYLKTDCDGSENSLYQQSQSVLSNVLQAGRHGLLVDIDSRTNRPVIKSYTAESIINWRYAGTTLVMLVLQETIEEPDGYGLKVIDQYRELVLENGRYVVRIWRADQDGNPQLVQLLDKDGNATNELAISKFGKTLPFIPFRFVGSRSNDSTIDDVPLYSLARLNIAHFRNSADYEDSVFYVGQAQPWIAGLTEEWRDHLEKQTTAYVGSRAPFLLPQGGAFGFAQPSPNSLVKEAMDQKEAQMVALGARLLDQNAIQVTATQNENDKEVSTSVLSMCAANTNEAYQTAISWCAALLDKTMSLVEEQNSFKINQDYSRVVIDAPAVTALVAMWQTGVIAKPDLRAYLRSEGIIATERTDEAIDDDLETEGPALGLVE